MGLGCVSGQASLGGGLGSESIREQTVMLDLILEPGERLEDFLAFLRDIGVLRSGHGPVDVVDGTGLD